MKKQTAVEWLSKRTFIPLHELEQAKQMEKEQIVEAWNGGNYGYFYSKGTKEDFNDGSEYYNEVYKGGSNE